MYKFTVVIREKKISKFILLLQGSQVEFCSSPLEEAETDQAAETGV